MSRLWRVYEPRLDPAVGRLVELSKDESHHLSKVLRLAEGELVAVFDGRGTEWCGELISAGVGEADLVDRKPGRRMAVRLVARLEDPVEPDRIVRLFQGLCRPDRMEWVIQKGTEIGLSSVHPWVSERVRVHPPKSARVDRWLRIAAEACKQSGRRTIPVVEAVEVLPHPAAGTLALLLDPDCETSFERLPHPQQGSEIWLAVGPESGLDPVEARSALDAGWIPCHLGRRILRTESAGIVATTLALHLWGDLSRG